MPTRRAALRTTSSDLVVASATLVAPGPGFVLVTASANVSNTVSITGSTAQVLYSLAGPNGQRSDNQFTTIGQYNVGDKSGATTHLFAVAAAGPQTFSLVARNYRGTSTAFPPCVGYLGHPPVILGTRSRRLPRSSTG